MSQNYSAFTSFLFKVYLGTSNESLTFLVIKCLSTEETCITYLILYMHRSTCVIHKRPLLPKVCSFCGQGSPGLSLSVRSPLKSCLWRCIRPSHLYILFLMTKVSKMLSESSCEAPLHLNCLARISPRVF